MAPLLQNQRGVLRRHGLFGRAASSHDLGYHIPRGRGARISVRHIDHLPARQPLPAPIGQPLAETSQTVSETVGGGIQGMLDRISLAFGTHIMARRAGGDLSLESPVRLGRMDLNQTYVHIAQPVEETRRMVDFPHGISPDPFADLDTASTYSNLHTATLVTPGP